MQEVVVEVLELRRRFQRWHAAAALLCAATVAATAPPLQAREVAAPPSYEPVALAWSAAEVERASARKLGPLVEQAGRIGEPACRELCQRLHRIFERLLPLARAQTPQAARLAWSLAVVVMQQGELEADELGLLLASRAGFAPRRQLAFIEREAARGDGRAPLVRSHPPTSQRVERLRARLPLAERVFAAGANGAHGAHGANGANGANGVSSMSSEAMGENRRAAAPAGEAHAR